jgi:hypothetical protein
MQKIDLRAAGALINFQGEDAVSSMLAGQQLAGTVALHNMLATHGAAYLADEVGMGKTYIALGVVALMRRFQPDLRVLYLLPKNNVRDKWRKDYRSFVAANYRHHDGIVKGIGQQPAAPYRNCATLRDLMQAVATDSVRDYFVCTSAFSLTLGDTNEALSAVLDDFRLQLPQYGAEVDKLKADLACLPDTAPERREFKRRVKTCWATALHGILPRFDLVVVDEAHNYRRGRVTSDRNYLLSLVLGTGPGQQPRIDKVLLLSATPFDRDVEELRRQLDLFGKADVLTAPASRCWNDVHQALAPFMVRRLNSLMLNGVEHTRNMYRTEHRTGESAEIELGIEQQLFAALMQKKVGEVLNASHHGKFELGMLASFESYLPNDAHKPVQFDGLEDETDLAGNVRDAADRTVVNALVHDFERTFSRFPPHPKMDKVAHRASGLALERNRKQLIFVRRVASVGELKAKLEDAYNDWLERHVAADTEVYAYFAKYREAVKDREHHRLDGGPEHDDPATFFSWFYRGDNPEVKALSPTPNSLRQTLRGAMFDIDWSTLPGMPAPDTLPWDRPGMSSVSSQDAQHAYLGSVAAYGTGAQQRAARTILANAFGNVRSASRAGGAGDIADGLGKAGLWRALRSRASLAGLALPWDQQTFDAIAGDDEPASRVVRRHLAHAQLFAALCRLDHPFIDLYSLRHARSRRGAGSADENMIAAFVDLLEQQSAQPGFSSYAVLRDLASHLDLILKQNFEDIDAKSAAELPTYIATQLHPLSPVLGATGHNAPSRSAYARKFRMPGYPRILVSTDVFQEGEDLHTFCDSVVHYGISSGPIALEQKTGRVDRIGSLSHRAMASAGPQYRDHFIQVSFPHVRQSLEFLQVRAAARNLNDFLISLQRVDGANTGYDPKLDLHSSLLDEGGIDPPLAFKLESPFTISAELLDGEGHPDIDAVQRILAERLRHCRDLVGLVLQRMTAQPAPSCVAHGASVWELPDAMTMELRGAQGNGQLILAASKPAAVAFDRAQAGSIGMLEYLARLQADPAVRLQMPALDEEEPGGSLIANAEIYAGGKDILSEGEVRDLYDRIALSRSRPAEGAGAGELADMVEGLCGDYASWTVRKTRGRALEYTFGIERCQQKVRWQVHAGYVAVCADVLTPEQAAERASANPELMVAHTLQRNRRFDVVDFHIDEQRGLAVRALHPLGHLNKEELAFICHLVASNAVRLRQVLTNPEPDDDNAQGGKAGAPRYDARLRSELDESDVMCIIRDQLSDGSLTEKQLTRGMARALGSIRTSSRWQAVLDSYLNAASRRRIVINQAGVVELYRRSMGEYDMAFLEDQFLAALSAHSKGFVERKDARQAFARWMGFARTGSSITEIGDTIIRRMIRRRRLAVQGSRIKRVQGRGTAGRPHRR